MQIKSILTGAAIALAAAVGSASADEKFTTLQGFQPTALNAVELGNIRGAHQISAGGGAAGVVLRTEQPNINAAQGGPNNSVPGLQGLSRAEDGNPHLNCVGTGC